MNFRWRATAAVPAAVLLLVACIQLTLTRTSGLSPWKGGGFGMFSTTDDAGRRSVRVFVTAPDRSEELTITIKTRNNSFSFPGLLYLRHWAIPNFFFHMTTAYNLLRHNGVELGKADFLGGVQQ